MSRFRLPTAAALALLAPALAFAQPTTIERTAEAVATVESVDQAARAAVLRLPNGELRTVRPGPEVRNFAQIRPGSQVVVSYTEALAVAIAKADGAPPVAAVEGAARAPVGAQPGAAEARAVRVRVKVETIDLRNNRVGIVNPAGQQRVVTVRNPAMQRFIRTLRVGEEVDVTFTEILTITVRPPS
jgi:hypothetical protein